MPSESQTESFGANLYVVLEFSTKIFSFAMDSGLCIFHRNQSGVNKVNLNVKCSYHDAFLVETASFSPPNLIDSNVCKIGFKIALEELLLVVGLSLMYASQA